MLIRVIADDDRAMSVVQAVETVPQVGDRLEVDDREMIVRAVLATSHESTIAAYVYVSVVRR